MDCSMRRVHLEATIISVVAFIVLVVSTSTDHWLVSADQMYSVDMYVNIGLWKVCTKVATAVKCATYTSSGWNAGTQAFMILSDLSSGAACFINVLLVLERFKWELIAALVNVIPVCFTCAALVIYGFGIKMDGFIYGYSFYCGLGGLVLFNIASISLFYSHYKLKCNTFDADNGPQMLPFNPDKP